MTHQPYPRHPVREQKQEDGLGNNTPPTHLFNFDEAKQSLFPVMVLSHTVSLVLYFVELYIIDNY